MREIKKAHEFVTTGSHGSAGFPCAVVLTVSFVLAPETGRRPGLLFPSPA
jgi:hypothetical protein